MSNNGIPLALHLNAPPVNLYFASPADPNLVKSNANLRHILKRNLNITTNDAP
jgi:hypothetical protein